MRIFMVRNVASGEYVHSWKKVDNHIEVVYSGIANCFVLKSLAEVRLLIEVITHNNSDHCDLDDLEIVPFDIQNPIRWGEVLRDTE